MKQKNSLKIFLFCLLLSLALHLLVAAKFSPKMNEPQLPPVAENESGGNNKDETTTIWVSPGIIPCSTYEGIGVQFNSVTGIVNYVASGSPADKAGLEIGDELITPLWSMSLVFGQKIQLIVSRKGKQLTLPIIVDKICQQ
jgi:hypothetical protein